MTDNTSHKSFRATIRFYLIDCETVTGKLIDIVIVLLNLLICGIFIAETYVTSEAARVVLWKTEVVIILFFIVEYAARLYGSRNRLRQLVDIYSIIDLLAILPALVLIISNWLGITVGIGFFIIIRSFRVFRIFRFLRFTTNPVFFFGSFSIHFLNVLRLMLTIMIIFFVSSGLFYQMEHQTNPQVHNFGDAFYFTVAALTTVGFGDIVPLTQGGRWVTILMILSGIILIPWQASRIVREWVQMSAKTDTICGQCGLRYHDRDASHCKSCGHVIYQEYEG
ncbi:MAG: ion transporter [Deltaproteobacteria bacterium]|nr:ion transporter [Deltaproteobacteria bacterium]MBW2678999.1 ion transporter [Deltaproteobacteria bacterium]